MTALPRSLARWQAQLSLFSDDKATLLGALVRRLAPSFDSLVTAELEPSGDVDGFDGVANRGSYERLLASEWMLRTCAPLEFLRRAANGEQTFFQLALRRPALPEGSLVLFDAGPDQLGDCRLAQLALLVLLVQRAQSLGHELHWQLLHHCGEGLHAGLSEHVVRAFLKGRTGARSTAATFDAWREQAQGRRLWLIGPPAITTWRSSAFACVTLLERVAPGERVLDVTLQSGAQTRRVTLDLPEPALAARLIRDPLEQLQARTSSVDAVTSHLRLNPQGSRLFFRNGRGDLVSTPIPNSPAATPGQARSFPAGEGALVSCVGGRGRRLIWLEHARGEVTVRFADPRERPKAELCADGPLPHRRMLAPLAWFPGELAAVFPAFDHSLWRVDFRTQRSRKIAEGARAWLTLGDRQLVAVDRWLSDKATPCASVLELKPCGETLALEGPDSWQDAKLTRTNQSGPSFTLAFEEDHTWRQQQYAWERGCWSLHARASLQPPPSTRVLGSEIFEVRQPRPGLWLLDASLREISIVHVDCSTFSVLKTTSDIVDASLACGAQTLAVATQAGALFVVDARGKLLYRGETRT